MTQKELMKKYNDFISWYDPYNMGGDDAETTETTPEGAIYNLVEIKKDLALDGSDDREIIDAKIRVNDLLLKFRDSGYKVVV